MMFFLVVFITKTPIIWPYADLKHCLNLLNDLALTVLFEYHWLVLCTRNVDCRKDYKLILIDDFLHVMRTCYINLIRSITVSLDTFYIFIRTKHWKQQIAKCHRTVFDKSYKPWPGQQAYECPFLQCLINMYSVMIFLWL